MRKLLILLVLISLSTRAQNYYKTLLVEGKTWNLAHVKDMKFKGSYFLDRDTVLGGKECHVISHEYVNFITTSKKKKDDGIFYEEEGKVYAWDNTNESFTIYFDFTASTGDTIRWGRSPVRLLEVTNVDSVSLRGNVLRRLTFRNLTDTLDTQRGVFTGQWIEGMGSDWGVLCFPYELSDDGYRFLDCQYEGKTLYDYSLFTDTVTAYDKRMLSYDPSFVCSLSGEGTAYSKEVVVRTGMEQSMIMRSNEQRSRFTTFDVAIYRSDEESAAPDSMEMKLYERRGKVYVVQPNYQNYIQRLFPNIREPYTHLGIPPESVLLYDFTLETGDQYPCRGEVYVKETGTMTSRDGIERKTMVLTNGLVIIEGIGCINSPLGVFGYQNQTTDVGGSSAIGMESFSKDGLDGEPIYQSGDCQELSLRNTINSSITKTPSIHDLQGRRLASPLEKGVYIQDGKKYVK